MIFNQIFFVFYAILNLILYLANAITIDTCLNSINYAPDNNRVII